MAVSVAGELDKRWQMSWIFKILYVVNFAIIVSALLAPIVESTVKTGDYDWQLTYYGIVVLLSITFCISFLCLNVYGFVKDKQYRIRYFWIAIFISVWVIFGTYQLLYAYMHEMPF
jgi:heme/copper-type cytochrome/quinol oxidase subunit 4